MTDERTLEEKAAGWRPFFFVCGVLIISVLEKKLYYNESFCRIRRLGGSVFDRLRLASGVLIPPSMMVTLDAGKTQFSVAASAQDAMDGFSALEDESWLVFVETELRQAVMLQAGTRGDGGTTLLPVPEDWTTAQVKAYCFATSADGKEVSDSKQLTITPQA